VKQPSSESPNQKIYIKKKQRNKNSEINTTTKEKPNQKKQVER
jgi:hypothetical protein